MDHEVTTESIVSVRFGFYKDEEVKRMSYRRITSPELIDGLGRPAVGGLYDPALGPLDDLSICKSCSQISSQCPGHCGHIDLVSVVYNPLLFDMLYNLLQRTCFICHHFRADPAQVERCASRLEHIIDGDVVGAEELNSSARDGCYNIYRGQKTPEWTSFQYSAAMSELNNFLKQRHKDCRNCKAKNPTISKPTFGWFEMSTASADIRANIVRDCKLQSPITDGDVENPCTAPDKKQLPVEYIKQKSFLRGQLFPPDVMLLLENLWENESRLCSFICDIQEGIRGKYAGKESFAMFFLKTVLVPPIKFRQPARKGDSVLVHPQTVLFGKVLEANISLANAHLNKSKNFLIVRRWLELQLALNVLFDSKTAAGRAQKDAGPGICQLLEKKEGIFRQKMMGKRVNFACRSVISPDPYLSVNEIGIPPYFALRLTYPERVTPWNTISLRDSIVNGPDTYPGATHYVDKVGTRKLPLCRRTRVSISRKLLSSRGVAAAPGRSDNAFEGKMVYRHLRDGDIVLVNRQPTLHKPSLMAHVVRVLKGEQTLRMHYANCSTYNADFDGDEMNVHFPQDEISRAEAYNIVNANNQYIIPTRGDAGRGLIQDHIVSAVLLTKKDTFLTHEEFNQLLYSSGVSNVGPVHFSGSQGKKVQVLDYESEMEPIQPAILKPKPLWSGKQVITAVLNHITRGQSPFTVEKDGKIPREYFGSDGNTEEKEMHHGEHALLVYRNELLHGVIDKAQFGNYGLVHTVQELYGSNVAGSLLSVFSRLFTVFLQVHGFTCGMDDLLILADYDVKRKRELEQAENLGEEVHSEFIGLKVDRLDSTRLQLDVEKAIRDNGDSAISCLDRMMSSELNHRTSDINKDLLHKGLRKLFPKNCISLMTTTGAKGSMVNFSQISSFLGQQELEGKRVPRMISGKTLPCFPPWDYSSRAGGFISDRFLSGLRPQEYYFHCMAGREGLVDTAVKTSRSGYLQRCLIKNLECLKVSYDYTVRDADGSIVQFCYGEDGVDVHQSSFLVEFRSLAANQDILQEKFDLKLENKRDEINGDIDRLPFVRNLSEKERHVYFNMLPKDSRENIPTQQREDLTNLMKHKYFFSLAQPGEPVGILAAQSVGEPTTQMTLNTFHLAGRGEMNVTLGIPRLQEILMTAMDDIRTPIMECPLQKEKTINDGRRLAARLKKITLINVVESMEVCVVPVAQHNNEACSIYKLKIKLYDAKHFPPYTSISVEDCAEILEVVYVRELEDAIHSHILLLSRINGIKYIGDEQVHKGGGDTPGNEGKGDGDEVDDGNDDEQADDIGLDAQKRRQQVIDEVDYEDGSDMEIYEELSVGKGDDGGEGEVIDREDDDVDVVDAECSKGIVVPRGSEKAVPLNDKEAKMMSKKERKLRKLSKKDTDRCIYAAIDGLHFEAHFRFVHEPHILLGQVAQRAAKKVCLRSHGKISRCEVIERSSKTLVGWEDGGEQGERRVLQAGGVDFKSFWKMQDDLDMQYMYSNNIHAMLKTYGVEAARTTIIREVQNVFGMYGTSVNYRHLSLIADYMTHNGGYRPMNRIGAIAESVSSFSRMTFETASRFIAQAACHGETDRLESPSARICLGLPVKMGTGCFGLMQNLGV